MRSFLILAATAALLAVGIAGPAQARGWGCFSRSVGCYSPHRSYGWSSYSYCRPSYFSYSSYCAPRYYSSYCRPSYVSLFRPSYYSSYCGPSYYPSYYRSSYTYVRPYSYDACGPYSVYDGLPYGGYSAGYSPYVPSGYGPYEPSYVYDPQSASNTSAIVTQVAGELLNRLAARRAAAGRTPILANIPSRTTVSTAPMRAYTLSPSPVIAATPATPAAPTTRPLVIPNDPLAGTTPVTVARPQPAASNDAAVQRAWQFIAYGDRYFTEQKYRDAVERYRSATAAAPDLAEAHFRLAFAYIGTNRPQLAAESFRKGLALDKDWPQSSFRLDELYKDSRLAKQSHLDVLAQTALNNPNDADAFFALGVFLHFDGQSDRAQKFFVRAKELSADSSLVDAFLLPALPAPVAAPTTPVATQAPSGFDA